MSLDRKDIKVRQHPMIAEYDSTFLCFIDGYI